MTQRVLIVEDEPNIVLSLEFLLGEEGYEVRVAESGEDALEQVPRWRPQLVLLDIMLPGLDGFEICRRLRTTETPPKVILLTARGDGAEKVKGLDLGAAAYITKPFSARALLADVRRILAESEDDG